jgi:hypothetical protein
MHLHVRLFGAFLLCVLHSFDTTALLKKYHDTQNNDILPSDTQHNDTWHDDTRTNRTNDNDTKHSSKKPLQIQS